MVKLYEKWSLLTAWKRYHRRRSGGGREAAGKERAQGFEDGGSGADHFLPDFEKTQCFRQYGGSEHQV